MGGRLGVVGGGGGLGRLGSAIAVVCTRRCSSAVFVFFGLALVSVEPPPPSLSLYFLSICFSNCFCFSSALSIYKDIFWTASLGPTSGTSHKPIRGPNVVKKCFFLQTLCLE